MIPCPGPVPQPDYGPVSIAASLVLPIAAWAVYGPWASIAASTVTWCIAKLLGRRYMRRLEAWSAHFDAYVQQEVEAGRAPLECLDLLSTSGKPRRLRL